MDFEKQTYAAKREVIDGHHYIDCHFEGTTLVYTGGELPDFTRCTFKNYRMEFEGPALNTLAVLRAMAQPGSGFEPVFNQMFPKQR